MTTPNNQPTPPEGMRLLTPEEYKNRLPEDSVYSPDGENWCKSGNIGKRPFIQHIYAVPIAHPATGDVDMCPDCNRPMRWICDPTGNTDFYVCFSCENETGDAKPVEQRQGLLPCPFCGRSSALSVEQNDEYSDEDLDDSDIFYHVICDFNDGGCGSSGGFKQPLEKAIALWNTRK